MCVKAQNPEIDWDLADLEMSLAPCPFCGKQIAMFINCQELRACASARACEDGHYLSVVCSFQRGGCGASTGFFPTPLEAAEAWNRRAGQAETGTPLNRP